MTVALPEDSAPTPNARAARSSMAKKLDLSFVKEVSDMRGFQSHVLGDTDSLVVVGAPHPKP